MRGLLKVKILDWEKIFEKALITYHWNQLSKNHTVKPSFYMLQ